MNWNGIVSRLERAGFLRWIPTAMFLKQKYKRITHKTLDLKRPVTYTEKLQALKIKYKKSPDLGLYTKLADKVTAKELVSKAIGSEYIIPTLGVWDKFDDINFDELPEQFVLKTNHDSGGVVICGDKSVFDKAKAKKKLEKSLHRNFYWYGREPQYKNIKPRILAERYMENDEEWGLQDYKFFCFGGKVEFTMLCSERFSDTGLKIDFYDFEWNKMKLKRMDHPNSDHFTPKPENYEQMVKLAEFLSKDIPFLRVDFYEVKGKVYFGELTFFPSSGFQRFVPDEMNEKYGNLIRIP